MQATPDKNQMSSLIKISCQLPANKYIYISKLALKSHEEVELHAVGSACCTAILTFENLIR